MAGWGREGEGGRAPVTDVRAVGHGEGGWGASARKKAAATEQRPR